MAKGVKWMRPPNRFFCNFSREWEEFLLQTKFLAIGSSLGHLSMKKFRSDCLGSKIRQREGAGGGGHPLIEQKMTYFYYHENDIQS